MGVEYAHYVIPRPNTFIPEPAAIARFLEALVRERWLPATEDQGPKGRLHRFGSPQVEVPGGADAAWFREHLAEGADLKIRWTVDDTEEKGLRDPLDEYAGNDESFDLEIHRSGGDYFFVASDVIQAESELECECGESRVTRNLGQTPVGLLKRGEERIAHTCSKCGRVFDPTDFPVKVRNWHTGEPGLIPGGAYYRFALVIDCGKNTPTDPRVALDRDLRALAERELGCELYEIGDMR
jgi:hypothetical protein